jgi:hypothetical protein
MILLYPAEMLIDVSRVGTGNCSAKEYTQTDEKQSLVHWRFFVEMN